MAKLGRKGLGVRFTYVTLGILVFLVSIVILGKFPNLNQDSVLSTLEWLLGAIMVAVGGDTIRPSGHSKAAISLAPAKDDAAEVE